MALKVRGKPTVIDLNEDYGVTLRVFPSSRNGEDHATGVSVEFVVEDRNIFVAFTADTEAKADRIINALISAKKQAFQ